MSFFITSSSSPSAELSAFVWATAGGVAVIMGLALEKISDWLNDKFLGGYKPHKWIGEGGWWILMLGITIETGVAGCSAMDEWQTRQIANKNNPLNQNISDVSAVAVIELKGLGLNEIDPKISPHMAAFLILRDSNTNSVRLGSGMLVSDDFKKMPSYTTERGNNTWYLLRFHSELTGLSGSNEPASKIETVKFLNINALFLPTNSEVTWGNVSLIVNSEIHKPFEIPPQKNLLPEFDGMSGIMIFATNSTTAKVQLGKMK